MRLIIFNMCYGMKFQNQVPLQNRGGNPPRKGTGVIAEGDFLVVWKFKVRGDSLI